MIFKTILKKLKIEQQDPRKSIKIYCRNCLFFRLTIVKHHTYLWGRRGLDRMVFGFTNICGISAYHH
jgi:hypothetical protein